MAAQAKLFDLPPRKTVKRMHVTDAGNDAVQFRCNRCEYVSEWIRWNEGGTDGALSVTEAKRGLPCPQCNRSDHPGPLPMNHRAGEMLSRMISLATERHAGQFDKGGRPYILHPLTVMHRLRTDDEELQCIAVGHDLIEDTDVTVVELLDMGFSPRVVSGIELLTKRPDVSPEDYRAAIKASPDARRVKIEDLRHNSDIRRLKGVTEKDVKRMVRYHEFYLELLANPPTGS